MNLRPSGYEPDELPDCSTPHQEGRAFYKRAPRPATRLEKLSKQRVRRGSDATESNVTAGRTIRGVVRRWAIRLRRLQR